MLKVVLNGWRDAEELSCCIFFFLFHFLLLFQYSPAHIFHFHEVPVVARVGLFPVIVWGPRVSHIYIHKHTQTHFPVLPLYTKWASVSIPIHIVSERTARRFECFKTAGSQRRSLHRVRTIF